MQELKGVNPKRGVCSNRFGSGNGGPIKPAPRLGPYIGIRGLVCPVEDGVQLGTNLVDIPKTVDAL